MCASVSYTSLLVCEHGINAVVITRLLLTVVHNVLLFSVFVLIALHLYSSVLHQPTLLPRTVTHMQHKVSTATTYLLFL
jgi:hypothetical protein